MRKPYLPWNVRFAVYCGQWLCLVELRHPATTGALALLLQTGRWPNVAVRMNYSITRSARTRFDCGIVIRSAEKLKAPRSSERHGCGDSALLALEEVHCLAAAQPFAHRLTHHAHAGGRHDPLACVNLEQVQPAVARYDG